MSRKKTSQQSSCDHVSKVLEWGYELTDGDLKQFVKVWGCTKCDIQADKPFVSDEFKEVDHSNCYYNPCFGCKAKGLQFATGDANGRVIESGTTQKKWDAELQAYRTAREQGMQPAGTTRAHVEEAYRASETLGKAYDSGSMPKSKDINKRTAEVLKHTGMV